MSTAHKADSRTEAPKPRGILQRFVRNRDGATAIEFTMLALPFSIMLLAIFESCISFAGQQVLSNSADNVARLLRTGQIRAADMNETKLKQMICDDIKVMVATGCPGLLVDLREFPSFEEAAKVKLKYTTDNDIDTAGFAVRPGLASSKNMLRVFYKWPVMTDIMRLAMSNLKDGKTLHFAAVVWQNEPFND